MDSYNVPRDFLALNLDIDSYDLFVLIKLLKKYQPKIIISEINEKIPYPVKFTVKYDDLHSWKGDHFFGYSINCLEHVLTKFNYKVLNVIYNNVVLIKNEEFNNIGNLEEAFKDGYVNAEERKNIFSWNNNVNHWLDLDEQTVIKEINLFFEKYKNQYLIGDECNKIIKDFLNE